MKASEWRSALVARSRVSSARASVPCGFVAVARRERAPTGSVEPACGISAAFAVETNGPDPTGTFVELVATRTDSGVGEQMAVEALKLCARSTSPIGDWEVLILSASGEDGGSFGALVFGGKRLATIGLSPANCCSTSTAGSSAGRRRARRASRRPCDRHRSR